MADVVPCYAYLNARIMPVLRGELFEIPLFEALIERGIGEVTGGGTLQAKNREIIHCGIDLDLQFTDANVAFVCELLNVRGAPKGSKLQFTRDGLRIEVPFGQDEGIGVYLNGTDLPPETYRTSDVNVVVESLARLPQELGRLRGHWQGPTETALYVYGPSADAIASAITPFMSGYPLCDRARVVRIA